MKRYASWGSDKVFRWKWRAALEDAIFAFKIRYKSDVTREVGKQVNDCMGLTKREKSK